ncbi:MAG: Spy/CpxP family protein refolding chaperone [Terriglobales bacterium]
MKTTKFKMLSAGLALLLMVGFAVSQEAGMAMGPGRGHHGAFAGGPLGFFTKALDLTDAQQTQIKQIIANEKPTLHPLMLQEGQAHQQMMQLVTSGNFDETKAQAIISQETQTHSQIEMEHARMMSQAYQLLTPDQKTKFAQLQARHQQRMAQHMQHEQSEPATPNQ